MILKNICRDSTVTVSYTHLDVYKRQLPVGHAVLAAVQEVDLVKPLPVAHLHDFGFEVSQCSVGTSVLEMCIRDRFLTCAYMLLKMLLSKPYPILKGIIAKLSLRICFYRV